MKNDAAIEILKQIKSDWNSYIVWVGNNYVANDWPPDRDEYIDMWERMQANMASVETLLKTK